MYGVRSPSKIAAKASRRGPIQPLENNREHHHYQGQGFKREQYHHNGPPDAMSSQKLIFNGKKNYNRPPSQPSVTNEPLWAQHEENIRFIAEAWRRTEQELEMSSRHGKIGGPQRYQEKIPVDVEGFEPFDLESWWGSRTLMNMNIQHTS